MVENDEVDDGVKCENRFLVPPEADNLAVTLVLPAATARR